jgi:hypothetical protein
VVEDNGRGMDPKKTPHLPQKRLCLIVCRRASIAEDLQKRGTSQIETLSQDVAGIDRRVVKMFNPAFGWCKSARFGTPGPG